MFVFVFLHNAAKSSGASFLTPYICTYPNTKHAWHNDERKMEIYIYYIILIYICFCDVLCRKGRLL